MKMPVRITLAVVVLSVPTTLVTVPSSAAPEQQIVQAAVVTDPRSILPTGQCPLIDYDTAHILRAASTGSLILQVSGIAPYPGMNVALKPLSYTTQPDYWGVYVTGCPPQVSLTVQTPFTVTLDADAKAPGRLGVEVFGKGWSRRITFP
jgi:hypothetical protein